MSALRRSTVGLLACVLAAACAAPASSPSPSARSSEDSTPSPTATDAASDSPPATGTPIAEEPPPLALEAVADNLSEPIGVATAPGGWLLVQEQAGRVTAIDPGSGDRAVAVDLTDRVLGGGERGLLGVALHPDWPDVGRAFVHYTARDTDAVISELAGAQEGDGPPVLDAASERLLLEIPDPYSNHNGGQLAFGPDGHLYVGLGDGGAGGDPLGNGQDATTLLGSLLRLDVAEPGAYGIPADNPFVDGGGAPEVFLFGLRNPWRFSFDIETGLLWIADVGQDAFEEVNRIDPATAGGANLGWNVMEAAHCFAIAACSQDGLVLPVAEYGREFGCSVTGGYVYRGTAIPALVGWYLFADYCTGIVFGVPSDATAPEDGTALAPPIVLDSGATVSSFGVDSGGELYLVDHAAGVLSRIVPAGG